MNRGAVTPLLLVLCLLAAGPLRGQQAYITDFTPKVGSANDVVTIFGTGFSTPGLSIYFYSGRLAAIRVISDTQVTATVPSGISTGPLGIPAGPGQTNYSSADFLAIGPGPYISDFSPRLGKVNDQVIILGVHFTNVTVTFSGVPDPTAFVSSAAGTQISAHVPAGATNGPITVRTPLGASNSPAPFTVVGQGPYITGFSPATGVAGTLVAITGLNLGNATAVRFNGSNAPSFSAPSDTQINVTAPTNVTTGPISVESPLGTSTTMTNFFAPPTITGFAPGAGRAGTNVNIFGMSLWGATAVTFNGTPSTNYTIVSNTWITARVPEGASDGPIRVIAPAGSAISTSQFIVQPTIFGFTPNFGPPGTVVTITGANFNVGIPVVMFNGIQAPLSGNPTFSQIKAIVPQGTSTGLISVQTSDGSHTNGARFYLPATITRFTPTNSASGTLVTVVGQNFTDASAVSFFGAPATNFSVLDNNTLTVTVPSNVITGPITITTPANTASSGSALFYGAPVITSFTPTHGLPGTNVIILGTNFLGTSAVRFNGTNTVIVSVDNGQILARVPAGAKTGPITVVAPGGANTSAGNFVLDYTADLQVSISGSPNPVTVGSNLTFQVTMLNNGPFDALNVTLTNILPASVELGSASLSQGTLVTNKNVLAGNLGTMSAGGSSILLVLTVVPRVPGTITNIATVASDTPDPNPTNNTYAASITVQPLALLSIVLISPDQVRVSWPSALANYSLESKAMLDPNVPWSTVTNPPTISGNEQYVTESNTAAAGFFRLRK